MAFKEIVGSIKTTEPRNVGQIFCLDALHDFFDAVGLDFICLNSIFDVFTLVYTTHSVFCLP